MPYATPQAYDQPSITPDLQFQYLYSTMGYFGNFTPVGIRCPVGLHHVFDYNSDIGKFYHLRIGMIKGNSILTSKIFKCEDVTIHISSM